MPLTVVVQWAIRMFRIDHLVAGISSTCRTRSVRSAIAAASHWQAQRNPISPVQLTRLIGVGEQTDISGISIVGSLLQLSLCYAAICRSLHNRPAPPNQSDTSFHRMRQFNLACNGRPSKLAMCRKESAPISEIAGNAIRMAAVSTWCSASYRPSDGQIGSPATLDQIAVKVDSQKRNRLSTSNGPADKDHRFPQDLSNPRQQGEQNLCFTASITGGRNQKSCDTVMGRNIGLPVADAATKRSQA